MLSVHLAAVRVATGVSDKGGVGQEPVCPLPFHELIELHHGPRGVGRAFAGAAKLEDQVESTLGTPTTWVRVVKHVVPRGVQRGARSGGGAWWGGAAPAVAIARRRTAAALLVPGIRRSKIRNNKKDLWGGGTTVAAGRRGHNTQRELRL